jgi:cell division protein ZapD
VNDTSIIYEFPLNERIRVFIRLEQLFTQFEHHLQGNTVADKRAALIIFFDIIAIFKRNDLKSETLKEIDRHINVLNKIAVNSNENVDTIKLKEILTKLNEMSLQLYAMQGKIGSHLSEDDLFQSIMQRSAIPGGTCSFDLPEFHYWLSQDESTRVNDLQRWGEPFTVVFFAIRLILDFIRSSRQVTQEIAQEGFFQITLDTSLPNQLIIVTLDKEQPYFVEISGGKHRCAIRFMSLLQNKQRPTQTTDNVAFLLSRCVF